MASVICALDSDQTIRDGTAVELMKSAAATLAVDQDADTVTTALTDNDTVLSHILDQLRIVNGDNFIHGIVGVDVGDLVDHIASDSNFIHGIVNVDVGDLFKDIASNNNYMHGIITITGNTVNINFGQVIGDIAAGGANSDAAQQALAEILKAFGVTQTGIHAILTGIAGSILTNDQIAQLLSQLISSTNMSLKNVVTIICALYNSRTITPQQAMTLLESTSPRWRTIRAAPVDRAVPARSPNRRSPRVCWIPPATTRMFPAALQLPRRPVRSRAPRRPRCSMSS